MLEMMLFNAYLFPQSQSSLSANRITQTNVHSSPELSLDSLIYPVPCAKYGRISILASSDSKEISNLVRGLNSMASVLASLGIVSDHHLSEYRKWGSTTFLDSLPADVINPMHKNVLENFFNEDTAALVRKRKAEEDIQATSHFANTRPKATTFPQPSPEDEERITQAGSSEELRKAIGLEGDVVHCGALIVSSFFFSATAFC
jgi:hypothetical protein